MNRKKNPPGLTTGGLDVVRSQLRISLNDPLRAISPVEIGHDRGNGYPRSGKNGLCAPYPLTALNLTGVPRPVVFTDLPQEIHANRLELENLTVDELPGLPIPLPAPVGVLETDFVSSDGETQLAERCPIVRLQVLNDPSDVLETDAALP
ncbi:hypothetical protein BL254_07825 [Protofrankia sp. BMG5.30]|uniref:Uncharacterized protein n=1 Tax=Protofrankia coriariae TaxID=1562887 RepID=A0ABR5F7V1_9ACTN|nr:MULTISPECIES: hypothetical protein [Protofrankia]KLL12799.1 hypothetical protein FrCorBMG51_01170 [Protofrankia coriariae]ONH36361.1 hypothetical protein BL254_07825 [Protofrankia sp. BMG5.30]